MKLEAASPLYSPESNEGRDRREMAIVYFDDHNPLRLYYELIDENEEPRLAAELYWSQLPGIHDNRELILKAGETSFLFYNETTIIEPDMCLHVVRFDFDGPYIFVAKMSIYRSQQLGATWKYVVDGYVNAVETAVVGNAGDY